ncbi:MAG: Rab family GTPase [Candidatus Lokiarchaeia archaeon]
MSFARYKICIFGDGGVGKTTLVNRYISGKFSEDFKMTIGVDFYTKSIEFEGIKVQLQIWDFGGEHQFKNLLPNYIIGASGGIYMYDISRFSSLTNLDDWLKVLKKTPGDSENCIPILLVAGKLDLEAEGKRVIEKEFAFEYGKKHNFFDFVECSSKTGENIDDIFNIITKKILKLTGLL